MNYSGIHIMSDGADLFVRLGFSPDWVEIRALNDGEQAFWHKSLGDAEHIQQVVAGDASLPGAAGITLVKFDDLDGKPNVQTGDPTAVSIDAREEADGIKLAAALNMLTDDALVHVTAGRDNTFSIRAVHDGTTSSNTYFEDSSIDFKKAGVGGPGRFVVFNQTNKNYAYTTDPIKPNGKTKHCRLMTYTDAACTSATTAADFDTSDVIFVFRLEEMGYPLSDITNALMT